MSRSRKIALVLSFLAFVAISGSASAAVDQPFGKCTEITDLIPSGEGGTVVAGPTGRCLPYPDGSFVAQLNSAGELDTSFGQGGVVSLPESWSPTLLRRADGSLLVSLDDRVVALRSDGTPDPGFGDGGAIPFGLNRLAESAAGKLVGGYGNMVWVLDADGAPDPAFNGGLPLELRGLEVDGAKIDSVGPLGFGPDGKALVSVSGYSAKGADAGGPRGFIGVLRLEPDGSIDAGYGTNGLAADVGSSAMFRPLELETSSDGSLRLFGNGFDDPSYQRSPPSQFMLSITAGGEPEYTELSFPNSANSEFEATGIDTGPDGSFLVGVEQSPCRDCDDPYSTLGTLAAGLFGSDGDVLPEFNGGLPASEAVGRGSRPGPVLLGEDGTATVAGRSGSIACGKGADTWRCKSVGSMVRFGPDGKPDPSFGDEGVVTLPACPVALCASRYHAPAPKIEARVRNGVLGITVNSRRYLPETADWLRLRLEFDGVRIKRKRVGSIEVQPRGVESYRLTREALRSGGRVLTIERIDRLIGNRIYKQTGNRIQIRIPVKALRLEPHSARRKSRLRVGMISMSKTDPKTKWAGTSIPRSGIGPGGPRRGRAGTGR